MKPILIAAVVGGMVCGFVLALVLIENTASSAPSAVSPEKPKSPVAPLVLDLTKRYDIYVRAEEAPEPVLFPGARVMGYAEAGSLPQGTLFKQWVVLELKDGRNAYVPDSALERLEEPKNPKDAQTPKESREKEATRY